MGTSFSGRILDFQSSNAGSIPAVPTKICCTCKTPKPETEFNVRSLTKSKMQSSCKECNRAYHKEHYKNNKAAYAAKARVATKVYREAIHRKVWAYLLEHPCINCDEKDPMVLQFDHRNPQEKIYCVAELITRWRPWEEILLEILKCDVRCANCHIRRTAKQFGWFKSLLAPQ